MSTDLPTKDPTELELTQDFAARMQDRVKELRAQVAQKDAEIATLRARLARTSPARIAPMRKAG